MRAGDHVRRATDRAGGGAASPAHPRQIMIRFAVLFLLLNGVFAFLTSGRVAQDCLHDPVARCVALLAKIILSFFGDASVAGRDLDFNHFGAQIVEACDGVLPASIYLSAVLAFPSRWVDKAIGVLIGLPAVFLINLLRVVTLMLVGANWPEVFERVHIYVWQSLVIALTMAVWVFWAERFVRARPRARR